MGYGSQTTATIRESRTIAVRVQSIMSQEARANTLRQIDYEQAFLTRETLRSPESASQRMVPFVAADNQVVAEWQSGEASEMEDPADNVTDVTLLAAIQACWLPASAGL